jgi:hypothetical protein
VELPPRLKGMMMRIDISRDDLPTLCKRFRALEAIVTAKEAQVRHLSEQLLELRSRTNPELLDSERQANAILTDEVEQLRAQQDAPTDAEIGSLADTITSWTKHDYAGEIAFARALLARYGVAPAAQGDEATIRDSLTVAQGDERAVEWLRRRQDWPMVSVPDYVAREIVAAFDRAALAASTSKGVVKHHPLQIQGGERAATERDTGKDRLAFEIWALVRGLDITPNDACGYVAEVTKRAWMRWNPPIETAISRQPGAGDAEDKASVLGELNDDLSEILGRMCFTCIRIAELFRISGQNIPRKAEAEQAAVIYFLLRAYQRHGKDWSTHADAEMRAMADAARAQRADAQGDGNA